WWMQHDVHLSRSKMRYEFLKVPKAGETEVQQLQTSDPDPRETAKPAYRNLHSED
ncbi:hypothetical protein EV126DRAFT_437713, partial [Verticillium dahliae]